MTATNQGSVRAPYELLYSAMKTATHSAATFDLPDDEWPSVLGWMEEDSSWAMPNNFRPLASLSPRRLADVVEAARRSAEKAGGEFLAWLTYLVAAKALSRGEALPREVVPLVDFRQWSRPNLYVGEPRTALWRVVQAMTEAEREPLFRAALERKGLALARALGSIAELAPEPIVAQAFEQLASDKTLWKLEDGLLYAVRQGAGRIDRHIAKLAAETQDAKVRELIGDQLWGTEKYPGDTVEDVLAAFLEANGVSAGLASDETAADRFKAIVAPLLARLGQPVRIAVLEPTRGKVARSRIGGAGPSAKRPKGLQHVLTLAPGDVPGLFSDGVEGVAVYIEDVAELGTPKAVFLSAAELAKGFGKGKGAMTEQAMRVTLVDVPVAIFEVDPADPQLRAARAALIGLPGHAGGEAVWVQGPEKVGSFVLQLNEGLADVNLGDSGTLYVFTDRALVQSF